MSRLENGIGVASGYFAKWFSRGSLDFGMLLKALEFLEIAPRDFFAEVFGDDDPGTGQAATKAGPKRARPKLRSSTGPETMGVPDWIEELDELRYHDAEAAIRELWSRVDDVEGAAVAHYLGTLGSAYRSIGNLPEARECLQRAEARAVDDLGFGDALQRLSYLSLYEGDAERALSLAEQAAGVFARGGLWVRFGEAHVDQAQAFFHQGALESQWRCLDTAAFHLEEAIQTSRLRRNLFSLKQLRALNRRSAGDLASALALTLSASEVAPDPKAEGYCWALYGEILRDLARFPEAARAFRRARALIGVEPYAALAVTADIVECLARCRENRKAYREAERVAALVGAVEPSSLTRAAAIKLWALARKRRLSIAAIDAVRSAARGELRDRRPDCGLGARVARLRRLSEVPRRQLAVAAGIPAETLRKLESGDCSASKHQEALERWMQTARPELGLLP